MLHCAAAVFHREGEKHCQSVVLLPFRAVPKKLLHGRGRRWRRRRRANVANHEKKTPVVVAVNQMPPPPSHPIGTTIADITITMTRPYGALDRFRLILPRNHWQQSDPRTVQVYARRLYQHFYGLAETVAKVNVPTKGRPERRIA
jgi:hypothetical protein